MTPRKFLEDAHKLEWSGDKEKAIKAYEFIISQFPGTYEAETAEIDLADIVRPLPSLSPNQKNGNLNELEGESFDVKLPDTSFALKFRQSVRFKDASVFLTNADVRLTEIDESGKPQVLRRVAKGSIEQVIITPYTIPASLRQQAFLSSTLWLAVPISVGRVGGLDATGKVWFLAFFTSLFISAVLVYIFRSFLVKNNADADLLENVRIICKGDKFIEFLATKEKINTIVKALGLESNSFLIDYQTSTQGEPTKSLSSHIPGYAQAICSTPLALLLIGGIYGALIGVIAYVINNKIFCSRLLPSAQILLVLMVSSSSFLIFWMTIDPIREFLGELLGLSGSVNGDFRWQ